MFLVHRRPVSADPGDPRYRKVYEANLAMESGVIRLTFLTPEEGDRQSLFEVFVEPANFKILAQAMMQANSEEAIKAIGGALEAGIPEQIKVWRPS